jgi:predicted peptidase
MRNLASYLASIVAVMVMHHIASARSYPFIYDDGQGNTMPYRLFLPPNHTSETDYPLVLYMHGAGERGTDNTRQLNGIDSLIAATQSDRFASYLLAPQAPVGMGWTSELGVNLTAGVFDEVVANYSVNSTRIYVTGYSAGGSGTFAQLYDYNDRFAAGVPVAAGLNGVTPELAEAIAPAYRNIPLWVFHGALDVYWPAEKARLLVDAIRAVGGSPLYTEFPDFGHGIRQYVYEDVNDELYAWMFSQQRIPEPASWVMIAWGVALTGLFRQRKKLR